MLSQAGRIVSLSYKCAQRKIGYSETTYCFGSLDARSEADDCRWSRGVHRMRTWCSLDRFDFENKEKPGGIMNVLPIKNSIMNSVTYVLYMEGVDYCVFIDCGFSEDLIPTLEKLGKRVKAVFLTHTHYDHIYGLDTLLEHYPDALVYTNKEGRQSLTDIKKNFSKYHPEIEPFIFNYTENVCLLEEGEIEIFKGRKMQVLFTPGHDVTCYSFIVDNNLFTGDAYIPGVKTVVNFPRSNRKDAIASLERLQDLEREGYKICPGHDMSEINSYKNRLAFVKK